MEKLLDKSINQTDRVVEIARQAIELNDKLIAERDRLRETNKELVEALKSVDVFISNIVKNGKEVRLNKDLCSIAHYAEYHSGVLSALLKKTA